MKKLLLATLVICSITLFSCSDVTIPDNISVENAVTEQTPASPEVTIEETVLLDAADVKITAKNFEDSFFGPQLKLLIENNTSKNLTFQARNASVNGYMADTMMSVDVAAGKKANDSITFSNLDKCAITTIADIELSFYIFDTDTWNEYHSSEMVKLTTSAEPTYTYTYDDSGSVAYEDGGIKIVAKGVANDSIFGPSIQLYIHNNSNKPITVQTRNVSINGFMVDAICSQDIMPEKHAITDITFLSSDIEENDITAIENAELSFHIFNTETWSTIKDTEPVTISFSK